MNIYCLWVPSYLYCSNIHTSWKKFIQKRHQTLTENGKNRPVRCTVMDGWTTTGVARIGQTAVTKLYQPPVSALPTTGATATGTVNRLPLALLQLATVSACSLSLAAVLVVFLCQSWLLCLWSFFVRAGCSDCCCLCQSWLQWLLLSLSELTAVIVVFLCQSWLLWLLSFFVRAGCCACGLSLSELTAVIVVFLCQSWLQWLLSFFVRAGCSDCCLSLSELTAVIVVFLCQSWLLWLLSCLCQSWLLWLWSFLVRADCCDCCLVFVRADCCDCGLSLSELTAVIVVFLCQSWLQW